ncbi:MAG TPA: hypothetical protein VFG78_05820 [Gemmatimonadota bacterium]|nr:hypothetical protein [Gemmatimonadota bacterium]
MKLVTAVLVFSLLPLTGVAVAQQPAEQEEDPPVVRLSFFMCDLGGGNGERIEQELESRDIPIWEALVQEGMVQDYGYLFHWWADEWNIVIYTIAPTIQAIVDASQEAQDRAEEQYGDAPTAFDEACPHHRDGLYTLGPNTGMNEGAAAAGN